jgi:hypothetical protein
MGGWAGQETDLYQPLSFFEHSQIYRLSTYSPPPRRRILAVNNSFLWRLKPVDFKGDFHLFTIYSPAAFGE